MATAISCWLAPFLSAQTAPRVYIMQSTVAPGAGIGWPVLFLLVPPPSEDRAIKSLFFFVLLFHSSPIGCSGSLSRCMQATRTAATCCLSDRFAAPPFFLHFPLGGFCAFHTHTSDVVVSCLRIACNHGAAFSYIFLFLSCPGRNERRRGKKERNQLASLSACDECTVLVRIALERRDGHARKRKTKDIREKEENKHRCR